MSAPADQVETVAFLTALAGAPPVETHISRVFLGRDTVWKLKKSVRLPFLDFSTIEAREHFCRRELALNAKAAPGLYRDVVPVVRGADGALALGGEGEPVDWIVRMARVPAVDFLDVLAAKAPLKPEMLDAIADAVALWHLSLPPATHARPDMAATAKGNATAARAAGLASEPVNAWLAAMHADLAATTAWQDARAAAGFVRRCHGDLHLGNLCLWQGRPVLFDALEFDESMATIDLGYDLAFLLMDLEHRQDRAAANRVLNRYVARTGDVGLVGGMQMFLSMRAIIRAHVEERVGRHGAAAAYLLAATRYLARRVLVPVAVGNAVPGGSGGPPGSPPGGSPGGSPGGPVVVAIGGLPGSGKSTLARALAPLLGPAPGALVLRSDEIRKRQHGVAPEQRLPPSAYTSGKSVAVFATLARDVETAAAMGQAVVADATFLNMAHRDMVRAAAARAGVPFAGLWLTAPRDELERRVAARTGDASDATVDVLRGAAKADPGPGAWHPVDATESSSALALVETILASYIVS